MKGSLNEVMLFITEEKAREKDFCKTKGCLIKELIIQNRPIDALRQF